MYTAVGVVPQGRLIVQAVTLNALGAGGIAEGLDDEVDVFVHVDHAVIGIGHQGEGGVLGQDDLVPPGRGRSLGFGDAAVFVRRHIARQLQGGQAVRDLVEARLVDEGGDRRTGGLIIAQIAVGGVVPVRSGVGGVVLPVVGGGAVAALPDGGGLHLLVLILVAILIDAIDIRADGLATGSQVNGDVHGILLRSCMSEGHCRTGRRQHKRQQHGHDPVHIYCLLYFSSAGGSSQKDIVGTGSDTGDSSMWNVPRFHVSM